LVLKKENLTRGKRNYDSLFKGRKGYRVEEDKKRGLGGGGGGGLGG